MVLQLLPVKGGKGLRFRKQQPPENKSDSPAISFAPQELEVFAVLELFKALKLTFWSVSRCYNDLKSCYKFIVLPVKS